MKESTMSRNFALVSYLDEQDVLLLCQRQSVMHYAIKTHDRDDGKQKHVHVVIRYNNPRTLASVKNEWNTYGIGKDNGKDVNTLGEICADLENAYWYLIHKRNPEKAQYEEKDIWTDNAGYFRGDYSSVKQGQKNAEHSENTAFQVLLDMENGVSMRELARRYGREIIINFGRYREFFELMKMEERPKTPAVQPPFLADVETGEIEKYGKYKGE